MKRVLHLSQTDIRSDSRILKEMKALSESGGAYLLHGIGVRGEGTHRSSDARALDIDAIGLRSRKMTFLARPLRHGLEVLELTAKALAKSVAFKPEIVHCHDTPALPLGALLKLVLGSKLVYDAHELESDKNGLSKALGVLTFYAEKALWPFVDLSITVSPTIEKWYQEKLGPKASGVILNSPIVGAGESSRAELGPSYLRDRFEIPEGSKIFIYVGILGVGRGLDLLLESFAEMPKSHLVCLGYGTMYDEIAEAAARHANVHLHDAVPHEQVVEVCRSADVGLCMVQKVSLSDYYCLPNKLFEYCFAGLQVLASNFPDMAATIEEYDLGECCDLDVESIRAAIDRLQKTKSDRSVDHEKLRPLSWQAQKEELLEVYGRLTAS